MSTQSRLPSNPLFPPTPSHFPSTTSSPSSTESSSPQTPSLSSLTTLIQLRGFDWLDDYLEGVKGVCERGRGAASGNLSQILKTPSKPKTPATARKTRTATAKDKQREGRVRLANLQLQMGGEDDENDDREKERGGIELGVGKSEKKPRSRGLLFGPLPPSNSTSTSSVPTSTVASPTPTPASSAVPLHSAVTSTSTSSATTVLPVPIRSLASTSALGMGASKAKMRDEGDNPFLDSQSIPSPIPPAKPEAKRTSPIGSLPDVATTSTPVIAMPSAEPASSVVTSSRSVVKGGLSGRKKGKESVAEKEGKDDQSEAPDFPTKQKEQEKAEGMEETEEEVNGMIEDQVEELEEETPVVEESAGEAEEREEDEDEMQVDLVPATTSASPRSTPAPQSTRKSSHSLRAITEQTSSTVKGKQTNVEAVEKSLRGLSLAKEGESERTPEPDSREEEQKLERVEPLDTMPESGEAQEVLPDSNRSSLVVEAVDREVNAEIASTPIEEQESSEMTESGSASSGIRESNSVSSVGEGSASGDSSNSTIRPTKRASTSRQTEFIIPLRDEDDEPQSQSQSRQRRSPSRQSTSTSSASNFSPSHLAFAALPARDPLKGKSIGGAGASRPRFTLFANPSPAKGGKVNEAEVAAGKEESRLRESVVAVPSSSATPGPAPKSQGPGVRSSWLRQAMANAGEDGRKSMAGNALRKKSERVEVIPDEDDEETRESVAQEYGVRPAMPERGGSTKSEGNTAEAVKPVTERLNAGRQTATPYDAPQSKLARMIAGLEEKKAQASLAAPTSRATLAGGAVANPAARGGWNPSRSTIGTGLLLKDELPAQDVEQDEEDVESEEEEEEPVPRHHSSRHPKESEASSIAPEADELDHVTSALAAVAERHFSPAPKASMLQARSSPFTRSAAASPREAITSKKIPSAASSPAQRGVTPAQRRVSARTTPRAQPIAPTTPVRQEPLQATTTPMASPPMHLMPGAFVIGPSRLGGPSHTKVPTPRVASPTKAKAVSPKIMAKQRTSTPPQAKQRPSREQDRARVEDDQPRKPAALAIKTRIDSAPTQPVPSPTKMFAIKPSMVAMGKKPARESPVKQVREPARSGLSMSTAMTVASDDSEESEEEERADESREDIEEAVAMLAKGLRLSAEPKDRSSPAPDEEEDDTRGTENSGNRSLASSQLGASTTRATAQRNMQLASSIARKIDGQRPAVGQIDSLMRAQQAKEREAAIAAKRLAEREAREQRKRDDARAKLEKQKEEEEVQRRERIAKQERLKKLRLEQEKRRKDQQEKLAAKEQAEKEKAALAASQKKADDAQRRAALAAKAKQARPPARREESVEPEARPTGPVRPHAPLKPIMPSMSAAGPSRTQPSAKPSLSAGMNKPVRPNKPSIQTAQRPLGVRSSTIRPDRNTVTPAGIPASLVNPVKAEARKPSIRPEDIELPEIDSDYAGDSEDEKNYGVADWANSPALRRAFDAQRQIDPSKIFGPMPEFKMDLIFENSRAAKRPRSSSVNWNGSDRLTEQERLEYAKRMNYRDDIAFKW